MTYEIKLPHFEGPFDLILYFIERNELDIYDIPIAQVTNNFLKYIQQAKELNIELASEFILVAATLVRVKVKMLLPRREIDELTGEEIDPRKELVEKLLEYKKYKEVCNTLVEMETARLNLINRGNIKRDISIINNSFTNEFELESLDMFKLFKAFQKVMQRFDDTEKRKHTIVKYDYTIQEEKKEISKYSNDKSSAIWDFEKIFNGCIDRVHCIFRFLALLELVQEQIVKIQLGVGVNNFQIVAKQAV